MDEKALFERLDRIIELQEESNKQPSALARIGNSVVTILGILSAVDLIVGWLGD